MGGRSTSPGGGTARRELAWVSDAVAGALRSSLGGSDLHLPSADGCEHRGLLRVVRRHRVAPLVAPWSAGGQVDEGLAARIRHLRNDDVRRGMRLEADTATVSLALDEARVRHLIVKGAALAAALGGEPFSRGGGDIDVWIDQDDLASAEVSLARLGWHRHDHGRGYDETPGSRAWRQMLRERSEVMLVASPRSIVDLHWRLTERANDLSFGFDRAWTESVVVAVGGVELRTLGPRHALEHLAVHARKEEWATLRHVADVVRAGSLLSEADRADVARESAEVRRALGVGAYLFPGILPQGLTPRDTRIVEESWQRLHEGQAWEVVRRRLTGLPALRARLDYESWMIRSAPGMRAALGRLWRTVWKVRLVVDSRRRPWRGRAVFELGAASGGGERLAREVVDVAGDGVDDGGRDRVG